MCFSDVRLDPDSLKMIYKLYNPTIDYYGTLNISTEAKINQSTDLKPPSAQHVVNVRSTLYQHTENLYTAWVSFKAGYTPTRFWESEAVRGSHGALLRLVCPAPSSLYGTFSHLPMPPVADSTAGGQRKSGRLRYAFFGLRWVCSGL